MDIGGGEGVEGASGGAGEGKEMAGEKAAATIMARKRDRPAPTSEEAGGTI